MNQNRKQNIIDIIDLLFVFLKKSLIILLVGIVFAAGLGGYKLFKSLRSASAANSSVATGVFDISKKLEGETETQYSTRVRNVNRAGDLINSINALNNQIENNRNYVANSVFMQIDAEDEAFSTASLVVTLDRNQSTRVDLALLSSYRQYILSGEYLESLSKELNINQSYITEVITANYENSSILVNTAGDSSNVGVVTISVIGPSVEFTDRIMDLIIESVDDKCNELNTTVVAHTVSIAARQSSYKVDSTTRDRQISITNRFESLQTQIINYDKSLDTIALDLGVDKSTIYRYFALSENEITQNTSISMKSILKYSIVGFALGIVLIVVVIALNYIFGNKFSTQAKFFARFSWVEKVGVNKPSKKRNSILRKIDVFTGDDNDLSVEKSNQLMANNIKNITSGMNKVLVTGTADFSKIEGFVKSLGIKAVVKSSFFNDPQGLENIADYDGIIIIEQRNYSKCKLVEEEIKMIENAHAKLIGAVIL